MSVDMSKYLYFACGGKSPPDWDRITDTPMIAAYLGVLKDKKIGPDGIAQKLDTVTTALVFYRQVVLEDNVLDGRHTKSANTTEAVRQLKKRYRKQKNVKNYQCVEESSRAVLSSEAINDLATSGDALQFNQSVLERIISHIEPDKDEINAHTMLLTDEIMVRSAQRPSAVANMRVREWERRENEGDVTILRVHDHKTSAQGPALLLLTAEREAALAEYRRLVKPLVDKNPENRGVFFLLAGGRVIQKHAQRVRALCGQFGVTPHTATQVRKAVQTMVAQNLSTEDQSVVNRQLGHSFKTGQDYYQLDRTRKNAAQASKLLSQATTSTGEETTKAPPARRRFFTQEELANIEDFFSEEIRKAQPPKRPSAESFLAKHPIGGRSAKDIVDKVRNIIKYSM